MRPSVLLALVAATALVRAESDVVDLTEKNFDSVLKDAPIALVEFYVRTVVLFITHVRTQSTFLYFFNDDRGRRRGVVWTFI